MGQMYTAFFKDVDGNMIKIKGVTVNKEDFREEPQQIFPHLEILRSCRRGYRLYQRNVELQRSVNRKCTIDKSLC